jgi:hypothetical protein
MEHALNEASDKSGVSGMRAISNWFGLDTKPETALERRTLK